MEEILERNSIINLVKHEIYANQMKMIHELNDMQEKKKDNEYLREIYEEYKGYRDGILKIKKDQEKKMEELLKYLEKSLEDAGLTELNIRKIRKERENIKNKLEDVRNELKELLQNTEK